MVDQNVTVNVTVSSSTVTRQGFGEPLLAVYHNHWPETVRQFSASDLTELTDAGATVNSPVYKMASALAAQNPSLSTFKVGRMETLPDFLNGRLTPTLTTEGLVVGCNVVSPDGTVTEVSYTNGASETIATIVTDLQGQLDAIVGLSATDDTTHTAWTADTAGDTFYFRDFEGGLEILHETDATGVAADLATILAADDEWYGLAVNGFSADQMDAAATFAEANGKLLAVSAQDSGVVDAASTTDVAATLFATSRSYVFALYGENSEQYSALAWMAVMFTRESGDATWSFKNLANVSRSNLTTGQKNAALAKRCNVFTSRGGQDVTFEGLTMSSTIPFIDQRRGLDELTARVNEDVTALLNAQEKINYTDAGIATVDTTVRATLEGFTVPRRNFLASFDTTVPRAADVAAATKSSRRLTMTFTAEGAGAIHGVTINGTVVI